MLPMAAPDPIVVVLDRDLEELLPLFMGRRKADQDALGIALAAGDFAAIRKIGHGMTGAGASYGFDHISELGQQLVDAARAGDSNALQQLKQDFDDDMARLIVKFM
jgi:HPt (histidine-containing phosphotransfer) domain-containing protein